MFSKNKQRLKANFIICLSTSKQSLMKCCFFLLFLLDINLEETLRDSLRTDNERNTWPGSLQNHCNWDWGTHNLKFIYVKVLLSDM